MTSSNPFRNRTATENRPQPTLDFSSIDTAPRPPPPTSFNVSQSSSSSDVADVHQKRDKPVKKVRVVSPPPLSPDSPQWPADVPPYGQEAGVAEFISEGEGEAWPQGHETNAGFGEAPNPFNTTLQDMEDASKIEQLHEERREEGAALKAANSGKGGMDVDAFKRLLLTGDSGTSSPIVKDPPTEAEYDTRPVVRRKESEDGSGKKLPPPPPPSSRHGRSLKLESEDSRNASPRPPPPETEIYKKLETDDAELPKKAVPAPPPRRGHARAESRIPAEIEETHSTITRSESLRAPLPPPPRRPQPQPQTASQVSPQPAPSLPAKSSPSAASFQEMAEPPPLEPLENKNSRVAPAPPPTRNKSVRRPPSIQSIDSTSKRVVAGAEGRHKEGPPPPPPRSRNSDDSMRPVGFEKAPEFEDDVAGPNILADLSALQREVDALRGKMHD